MISYMETDDGTQVVPLRAFELPGAPLHRRAIAFSDDAELAVAADDSVHVLPPLFPHTAPDDPDEPDEKPSSDNSDAGAPTTSTHASEVERTPDDAAGNDTASDAELFDQEDSANPLGEETPFFSGELDTRRQYTHGTRHIPASFPLHVEINRHLFDTAGLPYPYDSVLPRESDEDGEPRIFRHPVGAGTGIINATGGTINSVVDMQWSPRGLGRNGRCVLAVLTTSGVLTVFGESPARRTSLAKPGYNYSTWKIMWAVGERFIVPPQETYGEHLRSFAWAPGLNLGVAVLAAETDQREIIIFSVRRVTIRSHDKKPKESTAWHVREVTRFAALGPHPKGSFLEEGFVPTGTGYGLRWGPWLAVGSKKTAALSYVSRNYIGFRKVTVDELVPAGSMPNIHVHPEDWSGFCTFLSSDSFVVWEGTIHSVGQQRICRGILATPFIVKVFEVDLATSAPLAKKHSVSQCGTMYPTAREASFNPIMDAIIHPQEKTDYEKPVVYTAVRMSATHTNPDWYESNRPPGDPDPQWHHDIVERINISVPEYMFHRVPTASDAESGSDFAEDFFEIDPDLELDAPSEPFRPGAAREVPVPEVFVNHARLWGLAVSPGGGVTAALASYHPAHGIERGGFQRFKIRVMFDFVPPADRYTARKDEPVVPTATEDTQGNPVDGRVCARPISTEARVWEWMYGGGAGVAGVSAAAVRHPTEDDVARAGVRELFVGAREATQKCPYCKTGLRMTADGDIQCAGTVAQHAFDACSASGLAILEPFVSRSCGICGKATLMLEELRKHLPADKARRIPEHVIGNLCGRCGGKFVD